VTIAITNALQLEGRPALRQSFWAVLANFVLRMCTAQTGISKLPIKILTSPLDSATPIS